MPLLWLSVAFLLGLLAGNRAGWLPVAWAGVAAAAVALALAETHLFKGRVIIRAWRRWSPLPAGILIVFFALGALRYRTADRPLTPADLAWYNDRGQVRLLVIVDGLPEPTHTGVKFPVAITRGLSGLPEDVQGRAMVFTAAGRDWQYGDLVEVIGLPKTPPETGDFSYREALARQGIGAVFAYPRLSLVEHGHGGWLKTGIHTLRMRAYKVINEIFPQPEASLMAGVLLGIEADIPESIMGAFRATGTSHIIAISGYNIGILAVLFTRLAARVVRRIWAPAVAVGAVVFYTLLVGAQPSVVRAAIMGAIGLFGEIIGRRQAGVNSLAFVAALMALFNPRLPWDPGFQLSFTATLGLVLFADPLQEGFKKLAGRYLPVEWAARLARPVGEYFLFTLAAQVTTLPVIAFHFKQVSAVSLLANPLILPPQPLLMILGGVLVVFGMLFSGPARLLGLLVWPLPAYTIRMVELLAHIPGLLPVFDFSLGGMILAYAFVLLAAWKGRSLWERRRQVLPNVLLVVFGLGAAVAWQAALTLPDSRLHLALLPVADGPALLIRSPSGQAFLLGGGSNVQELESALARRLPLGRMKLDLVVLDGASKRPIQGLKPLLEHFRVRRVLSVPGESDKDRKLADAMTRANIDFEQLKPGQRFRLEDGVTLTVVAQEQSGFAMLMELGRVDVLVGVCAALGAPGARDLAGVDAMIVLDQDCPAAWGGQPLRPRVVAAAFPPPNTRGEGSRWLDVNERGWVELVSDGRRLWARAEK